MNALNSRQLSPLLAIACRSTGAIMIASYIVTALVSPWPYDFQDREWLSFNFIESIVRIGVIPLMGIVFLLGSCWIDSITRDNESGNKQKSALPMISFSLSGIFSLFFALLLILHLWNLFQWRSDQIDVIAKRASEAETERVGQLNQQLDQAKNNLTLLFENTGLRANMIEMGRLSDGDIAMLEQLDNNPEGLNTVEQQQQEALEQGEREIQQNIASDRQEAQEGIARLALKSGLETGIDSLLLTIGFGLIAGTGFILAK